MKRTIEIIPKPDITQAERQYVNDLLRQLKEVDGKGIVVFMDDALPMPIPDGLIEGPAKVYDAMVVGQNYTVEMLSNACGLAKSTCYRFINTLVDHGIVKRVAKVKGRGRPLFLYELNKKETES